MKRDKASDIKLNHLNSFCAINEGNPKRPILYHAYIKRADDYRIWDDEVGKKFENEDHFNKSFFSEFANKWSVHGPARINAAESLSKKMFWATVWLVMLAYGSYQCYNVINEYRGYPKKVTIEIKDADVVDFPAVSFCSLNPFTLQNISAFDDDSLWSDLIRIEEEYLHKDVCQNLTEGSGGYGYGGYDCYDFYSSGDYEDSDDSENTNCYYPYGTYGTTSIPMTEITNNSNPNLNGTIDELNNSAGELTNSTQANLNGTIDELDNIVGEILRKKRDSAASSQDVSNEDEASTATIYQNRFQCSRRYQRIMYRRLDSLGMRVPDTLIKEDISKCKIKNFEESEKILNDIPCQSIAIQDIYGYYNLEMIDCKPYIEKVENSIIKSICSTCCAASYTNKETCVTKEEYDIAEEEVNLEPSLGYLVYLIKDSYTTDASDVTSDFLPTKNDLKDFAFSKSDLISSCSFDQSRCTENDFMEWESDSYGKCYTFNSYFHKTNHVRQTRASGPKNGLRLTLNINTLNTLALLSPEVGIRLMVHSPKSWPFPDDEGINLPPGVMSSVKVKTRKIVRVPPPHGKCADIDLQTNYTYSQTLCKKLCLEKYIRKTCNCAMGVSPPYSNLTKLPVCNKFNPLQKFCVSNIVFTYYKGRMSCNCPQGCSEFEYEPTVTSSMNNNNYFRVIQSIKLINTGEELCSGATNGTVRFQVFLDKLSYEKITESMAYTFDTLVSNLGGNFGLFVGMSILSIVELIEFLIEVIGVIVNRNKKVKDSKKDSKRTPVFLLVENGVNDSGGFEKEMVLSEFKENNTIADVITKKRAQMAFTKIFLD